VANAKVTEVAVDAARQAVASRARAQVVDVLPMGAVGAAMSRAVISRAKVRKANAGPMVVVSAAMNQAAQS